MTIALIPAAGKSVRMGRPKLALPIGDRTVLELVIAALREADIAHILVVVSPHTPELAPLARAAGAHVLKLPRETADMRATVIQGLHWIEANFHPQPEDDWLLVPADHPTLDAGSVRQLLDARQSNRHCSIILPTFQGGRGHPTLIKWKHTEAIAALPEGTGLNSYFRGYASETLELAVESASVLFDMDVPEDYERLKKMWARST